MQKYHLKKYAQLILLVIYVGSPLSLYAAPLTTNNAPLQWPANFKPASEKEVSDVKGTFEIRVILTKDEPIEYVLLDKDKTYQLHFDTVPPEHTTGTQIVIKRAVKADEIGTASQVTTKSHLLVRSSDILVSAAGVTTAAATGPQKTLVMLVHFQDRKNPTTLSQVSQMIFKTVNDNYYESSYHKTTVIGKSVGPGTAPVNSTDNCETIINKVREFGVAMANRAGIHSDQFPHHLFLFPRTNSCSWAGLSTLGGNPSKSWSNGYNSIYVMAHELGHAIGVWHSNYLKCPNSPIDGTCTHVEYGDNADTMGAELNGAHFNAFQKERLGWVTYNTTPMIQTVKTPGTYAIHPFETYENNIKVLKVLKKNLADGSQDYYYIEFRQPIGADKYLGSCSNCDFTKGVLFHTGNNKNSNSSYILDMTPSASNQTLVALLPGKQFTDANTPTGRVTFTLKSISNGVAYVDIKFSSR